MGKKIYYTYHIETIISTRRCCWEKIRRQTPLRHHIMGQNSRRNQTGVRDGQKREYSVTGTAEAISTIIAKRNYQVKDLL